MTREALLERVGDAERLRGRRQVATAQNYPIALGICIRGLLLVMWTHHRSSCRRSSSPPELPRPSRCRRVFYARVLVVTSVLVALPVLVLVLGLVAFVFRLGVVFVFDSRYRLRCSFSFSLSPRRSSSSAAARRNTPPSVAFLVLQWSTRFASARGGRAASGGDRRAHRHRAIERRLHGSPLRTRRTDLEPASPSGLLRETGRGGMQRARTSARSSEARAPDRVCLRLPDGAPPYRRYRWGINVSDRIAARYDRELRSERRLVPRLAELAHEACDGRDRPRRTRRGRGGGSRRSAGSSGGLRPRPRRSGRRACRRRASSARRRRRPCRASFALAAGARAFVSRAGGPHRPRRPSSAAGFGRRLLRGRGGVSRASSVARAPREERRDARSTDEQGRTSAMRRAEARSCLASASASGRRASPVPRAGGAGGAADAGAATARGAIFAPASWRSASARDG